MLIRKATISDVESAAEIYEKIHSEEEAGQTTTGWQRGVYPTITTASGAEKRGELYVAEDENGIVGSAIFNHAQVDCYKEGNWELPCADNEVLVMHTLTVDPEQKGRGIGKAFVAFYEELARKKGCLALRIDTQAKNICARELYRKIGFHEVGIVPCNFNGIPDIQLVLIEKLL